MTGPPEPPHVHLFTLFPGRSYDGLVVRYPHQTNGDLEYSFAEAAERLASSYAGEANDDAILYPFLLLYRHAIELALKESIRLAARLRQVNGADDLALDDSVVRERLRTKHRHSIGALLNELGNHLTALDQPQLPPETKRMLTALATADPKGETFRYGSGSSDDTQHSMDFYQLAAAVRDAYRITSATYDMLENYAEAQADWVEDMHRLQADFDEEMRVEFETEMRAEYESDEEHY